MVPSAGASRGIEFEIDLVLDELVSNVIRHGLKDGKEHFIDVNVSCDGQELILEVEDDGVPFNPLDSPTPDINEPIEERGSGAWAFTLCGKSWITLPTNGARGKTTCS